MIAKNPSARVHIKSANTMKEFLKKNNQDFFVERTSTGYPTLIYNNIVYYVRDKVMQRSFLNKIITFQNDVKNSNLYNFIDEFEDSKIETQSKEIERTLLYKGFTVNPKEISYIGNAIKIDLNTAYWQTCKALKCIKSKTYNDIINNCIKSSRLKLTGTLGRKVLVTEYKKGMKVNVFMKKLPRKRKIFQNIYNRLRKYVDELMIYCWQRNPDNFIGYYVDCVWIKEYDDVLIEILKSIYDLKIEIVDLNFECNKHGKMNIIELSKEGITRYDGSYIPNEFVMYKNFYNFTFDLQNTKIEI